MWEKCIPLTPEVGTKQWNSQGHPWMRLSFQIFSNHMMPITLPFSGVCIWEVYGHWAKMPWNVRKKNSQRLRNLAALLCYPILPPYFARFC